jgi:hypothetical protein
MQTVRDDPELNDSATREICRKIKRKRHFEHRRRVRWTQFVILSLRVFGVAREPAMPPARARLEPFAERLAYADPILTSSSS